MSSEKAPGRSGMVLASMASCLAPTSASSDTSRRRSKFMLAPLVTATTVEPCLQVEGVSFSFAVVLVTAVLMAGIALFVFSTFSRYQPGSLHPPWIMEL